MKTPAVSLLLGVSVLLLSGLTVSADHPLVLMFSEDPVMTGSDVTLYCEKKTKGDAVKAFFYFNETQLVFDPEVNFIIHKVQQSDEGLYSCSTDLLGKSPESRLRVRDNPLVLKFSEDPVMTGSDVTMYCENKKGDFVKAYFYFNGTKLVTDPKVVFTIHKVQRSDEGLYSCSTDVYGKSPQVWLRVRDPLPTSDPHSTTLSTSSAAPPPGSDDVIPPSVSVISLFLHLVVICLSYI